MASTGIFVMSLRMKCRGMVSPLSRSSNYLYLTIFRSKRQGTTRAFPAFPNRTLLRIGRKTVTIKESTRRRYHGSRDLQGRGLSVTEAEPATKDDLGTAQDLLDTLTAQADEQAQSLAKTCQTLSKKEKELAAVQKKTTLTKEALIHARDLDYIGKRTFLGNYSLTEEEFSKLKKQADHGYMMDVENRRLKEELPPPRRRPFVGATSTTTLV